MMGTRCGFVLGIIVAQFSAFSAALGGVLTEKLGDDSLPMFLTSGCYFLLAVIHGLLLIHHRKGFYLEVVWWKYLIVAIVDTAASYFTLWSLQFTTVTSWALIQPSALLLGIPLSAVILKAHFTWKHIASALLAVTGVVLLVLSDASSHDDDDDDKKHSANELVLGDFIAFLGALLYGASSTAGEIVAKASNSKNEVLSMLGVFGFVLSLAISAALGELSPGMIPNTAAAVYSVLTFVAHYFYYASSIVVLELSGTAAFEVSLLGMNVWSVLGKITVLGGFHPNIVFFPIAMVTVISGVVFFTISGDPYKDLEKEEALLESETSDQECNSHC
eukprot:g5124.t1